MLFAARLAILAKVMAPEATVNAGYVPVTSPDPAGNTAQLKALAPVLTRYCEVVVGAAAKAAVVVAVVDNIWPAPVGVAAAVVVTVLEPVFT
jgi:hypothetical protein